jgi:hypothetical protein
MATASSVWFQCYEDWQTTFPWQQQYNEVCGLTPELNQLFLQLWLVVIQNKVPDFLMR